MLVGAHKVERRTVATRVDLAFAEFERLRALEEALEEFAGTAVVVSHDRWFLDRICTHLIVFEGESIAKMYIGNWSDYETMMQEKFGKDLTPHRVKYRALKR